MPRSLCYRSTIHKYGNRRLDNSAHDRRPHVTVKYWARDGEVHVAHIVTTDLKV